MKRFTLAALLAVATIVLSVLPTEAQARRLSRSKAGGSSCGCKSGQTPYCVYRNPYTRETYRIPPPTNCSCPKPSPGWRLVGRICY